MSLNPFAAAWTPPGATTLPRINVNSNTQSSEQASNTSFKRVPSSLTAALAASRTSSPGINPTHQASASSASPSLLGGSSDDEKEKAEKAEQSKEEHTDEERGVRLGAELRV